jgi:hypothetical protein
MLIIIIHNKMGFWTEKGGYGDVVTIMPGNGWMRVGSASIDKGFF